MLQCCKPLNKKLEYQTGKWAQGTVWFSDHYTKHQLGRIAVGIVVTMGYV